MIHNRMAQAQANLAETYSDTVYSLAEYRFGKHAISIAAHETAIVDYGDKIIVCRNGQATTITGNSLANKHNSVSYWRNVAANRGQRVARQVWIVS